MYVCVCVYTHADTYARQYKSRMHSPQLLVLIICYYINTTTSTNTYTINNTTSTNTYTKTNTGHSQLVLIFSQLVLIRIRIPIQVHEGGQLVLIFSQLVLIQIRIPIQVHEGGHTGQSSSTNI
jgi:hypothetical protein